MRRTILFYLILLFFSSFIFVEEKEVSFSTQAALSYIKDLASDAMLGRKSGQPGGVRAEEFIASKLKEWGVEPGGENGTYFQNFTFEHTNLEPGPALEIVSGRSKRNFYYRDGWMVWDFSGSGEFMADITFVGYGIHAPQRGYDDFSDINIKGKIALMILETPFQLAERLGEESGIQNRIKSIQELGARGVFMCPCSVRGNRTIRGNLDKSLYKKDFVILRVESEVAAFIFKNSATELNYLIQEMDSRQKPMPYETGAKALVSVHAIFDENRPARNVLGRITGRDKTLKNEYIFIAAHIDHEGIDPWGEVMHGADDNASGTAVAMEVARILKLSKTGLKRTVIFFLWAAEEQGYKGAWHYMKNPLYPLEKTVAYINMDMVGQGSGKIKLSGNFFRPDLWNFWKETLPASILETVVPLPTFQRRIPLYDPVVPTGIARFGLETDGYHLKYHQSRDDVDLIKPELLKRTGDFVKEMVIRLANDPRNWIPSFRREDYYLKVVNAVGFKPLKLSGIVEFEKTPKDSRMDLQLLVIDEEEIQGNALRVDVAKKIIAGFEKIKKSIGVSLYSSASQLEDNIRQRKTTFVPGVSGFSTFLDDPAWAEVLAQEGIVFVRADGPSFLFHNEGLSSRGKDIIEALNRSRLRFLVSGLSDSQAKFILERSDFPVVLLQKELPNGETLKLVKAKDALLGLIFEGKDPAAYWKKLNEARTIVGSDHVMIIYEQNFWEETSKKPMLEVLSEILKANYDWQDMVNICSSNFLRILDRTR